ncbi:MAG: CRISPR-associated endonuclease Cas1, partial [Planctomycetes bacterium]|nr:CRISPR-associated endonuclease Cas1 [Planctomycetota bacterium]
ETHRLIARMDLIEGEDGVVTPVDYKHGSPREDREGGGLEAWDTDRVQLAAQVLVLRDNGYRCDEGVVYYVATKQRVRVPVDDELVQFTLQALNRARATAEGGVIPPPLVDSPKCPRCSLVGICLPDETRQCHDVPPPQSLRQLTLFELEGPAGAQARPLDGEHEVRRLVPARDDLRPLYLNTQGLYVGKSGEVLTIRDKNKTAQEVRLREVSQLNVFGNVQISTQAVQALCSAEIPIAYFSQGGWFYGMTQGLGLKNVFLRREQFHWAGSAWFCLEMARALVAGKIRNSRTLLQRNHVEPPATALAHLKCMAEDAERAATQEELLGIEGNAARVYFEQFNGMIKVEEGSGFGVQGSGEGFSFHFAHRNRRPPRDPINALLSLAYSLLAKDLTIVCHAVGFDPFWGFYHQPRFGRPALALDLMEPFRPLIADSVVINAVNTRMVTARDFIRVGPSVALKPEGRRAFFRAYEQRVDTLVTHPLFGYRVNYRRVLEIQARLLARVLTGELNRYPVFVTR